jgi:hypothetical protein
MSMIYNSKNVHFRRYVLHVVEYVLNIVEHDVYKYIFLNVKENEISVYLNCDKVDICLAVKYYILKWMKICISKLQTYINIITLIKNVLVCHVYISLNKYAHNWFSRVLFIATHNEIVIENGYQYLFPKMKKKMKY